MQIWILLDTNVGIIKCNSNIFTFHCQYDQNHDKTFVIKKTDEMYLPFPFDSCFLTLCSKKSKLFPKSHSSSKFLMKLTCAQCIGFHKKARCLVLWCTSAAWLNIKPLPQYFCVWVKNCCKCSKVQGSLDDKWF